MATNNWSPMRWPWVSFDALEIIKVQEQDRAHATLARDPRVSLGKSIEEEGPISEARQRVVQRLVRQAER
jgi:hypothetical protein